MQQLLSLQDAADRLGVHVTTLREWVRGRRLPSYRLGQRFTRVDWDEVLNCLAQRDVETRTDGSSAPESGSDS